MRDRYFKTARSDHKLITTNYNYGLVYRHIGGDGDRTDITYSALSWWMLNKKQTEMRKKWNISCLVIGFFLLVIVFSLHKELGNYFIVLLGNFLIWLSVPTLGDNILELLQSPSNGDLWGAYWRINGFGGITNCLGLIAIGLILIVISII